MAQSELNLKDIVEDFTKSSTKSLKIKLSNLTLPKLKANLFSGVAANLKVGSKKVVLSVEAMWRPNYRGALNSLSFLLKEAAGMPAIKEARQVFVSFEVADSSQAFPRLVSGSADKTAAIWDIWTGARLHNFRGHTAMITQVLVADKYGLQLLFTSSRDKVPSFE